MNIQAESSDSEDGGILCQQMKNISSRIWLSSCSCQWWERVGVRTALSPGLGIFDTGWRDGLGGPGVGLGAVMGDMMSNNSTTETSILELNWKKDLFEDCWRHRRLHKLRLQRVSTEPKPARVARQEQSCLQVWEKPRTGDAHAFWNRNEGMCSGINKAKTGQIKIIEIQSLSLAALINYSACTRADDGHSTYRAWTL